MSHVDEQVQRIGAVFRRRRPLGEDTNFFEAGFTSALLVEVLADLKGMGLTLSLVDLYRYPTLRALAAQACGPAGAPADDGPPLPWLR